MSSSRLSLQHSCCVPLLNYRLCTNRPTDLHACTGSLYRLHDGHTVPLSLPGSMDPTFDLLNSPSTAFPQTRQGSLAVSGSSTTDTSSSAGTAVAAPLSGRAATSSPSSGQLATFLAPENACHCCPVCLSPQAAQQAGSSPVGSQRGTVIQRQRVASRTFATCCAVDNPADAHFMAMAAKLVYEDPRVIADCLEHRCCCCKIAIGLESILS